MPTTIDPAAQPRIRHTRGPAKLNFGDLTLVRGEWSQPIAHALAAECMRPGHVADYGMEAEGYTPAQPDPAPEASSATATAPATAATPPRAPAPVRAKGTPATATTDPTQE